MEVDRLQTDPQPCIRRYGARIKFGRKTVLFILIWMFCQACSAPVQGTPQPPQITFDFIGAHITVPAPKPNLQIPTGPVQALSATPTSDADITPAEQPLVFAAIGDYGGAMTDTRELAQMMISWQPEFIITQGDNNYPAGAADHIDEAIGQFFHRYIYPYPGIYGEGADINRFFPTLGNHDVRTQIGQPYFDYFTLPGNERYYDFAWGPVHLFALDNLSTEPDGYRATSKQAAWLKERLVASTSAWNIVYGHYSPYSSGEHGSIKEVRWPFAEWGVDAVITAHDHTYERLLVDGVTYIVNGAGGYSLYDFDQVLKESQARYNEDYGTLRIEATEDTLLFQYFNREKDLIDQTELRK